MQVWMAAAAVVVMAMAAPAASAQDWHAVSGGMSDGRALPSMVELLDGRVLIIGGLDADSQATASVDIYDPATNAFSPAAPMRDARYVPFAARLLDGRVLVAGGASDAGGFTNASTEIYDPATNHWTVAADLPEPSWQGTAVTLADGRVFATGGLTIQLDPDTGDQLAATTAARTLLFDPVSGTWTAAAPLAAARKLHALVLVDGGKPLAVGGYDGNEESVLLSELYDPVLNSWVPAGENTTGHTLGVTAVLADGRVLVAGGASTQSNVQSTDTAELWTPGVGWIDVAPLADGRVFPAGGTMSDGSVIVGGGVNIVDGDLVTLASAERFDPATLSWSPVALLNELRFGPGSIVIAGGTRLLVVGGQDEFTVQSKNTGEFYLMNRPPTAVATVVSVGQAFPGGQAVVIVSAAGSTDDEPLTYAWSEGATTLLTTADATATLGLGVGTHALTLTASDGLGGTATASVDVTVVDGTLGLQAQIDQLTAINAALVAANTALTAENAALQAQVGPLQAQVAALTTQLQQAQQQATVCSAAMSLATGAVEAGFRARFRDPRFELPGHSPAVELAAIVAATLTAPNGCQQQIYKNLGGRR